MECLSREVIDDGRLWNKCFSFVWRKEMSKNIKLFIPKDRFL